MKHLNGINIANLYQGLLTATRNSLTEELNQQRIQRSEFGDIIKTIIPDLLRLALDAEYKDNMIDVEYERLKIEKKKLRNALKLDGSKKKLDDIQKKFIKRQIDSFDDKVLLDLLGTQVKAWSMFASSIGIDENSILKILSGDETCKIYNKIEDRLGVSSSDCYNTQ